MEVDWRKYQLNRYISDSKRALQRLEAGQTDQSFLNFSFNLLTSGLTSIPEYQLVDANLNAAMARLAEALHPYILNQGQWAQLTLVWSQIVADQDSLRDLSTRAELVKQLAITHNNQGQAKEAQYLYDQLVNWPDFKHLPPIQQAEILHQTGLCYLRQGVYPQAENFLVASVTLSNTHALWDIKGFALSQLGNIAMFRGDFRQAEAYYGESTLSFEVGGEENNLACVAYQSLGRFFVLAKQFTKAIPLLEKGLVIRRRRQEQNGIANNAVNLALAYLGVGRLNEAEELLDEAFPICKELHDQRGIALCHLAFGRLEKKRGSRTMAILQYRQALETLDVYPMPPLELQILSELLPYLLRTGQIRIFLVALIRLLQNLRQQELGMVAIWRLLKLQIRNLVPELLNHRLHNGN